MAKAYIALGANLGAPKQQLINALKSLSKNQFLTLVDYSSLYSSRPMGPQDQPDYINAVCRVESVLSAAETLHLLHKIEDDFGRQRLRHWGERTLDLDLLLFDSVQSDTATLVLPHPGLYQRDFVLLPLKEIAPELQLPNGCTVVEQCTKVTQTGLHMIFSSNQLTQELAKE
ncbi:MAG: 2-amino-4-hydroxy-6-hydroxymethyldihydropteridine diphosphokinase [Pseudomonadota bacterium]